MSTVIVIPARYASKRLPAKPLVQIAGKSLLQRVYEVATAVHVPNCPIQIVVATDHEDIQKHAQSFGAMVVMTPPECPSGSDRALACVRQLPNRPEIIINLQGDAPFTPPDFLSALIQAMLADPAADVVTPFDQLSWPQLDRLRANKLTTPFSGTTLILDQHGYALWFSKQIIPLMREEPKLRELSSLSPVRRHIGVYGYRYSALEKFVALPESHYEKLEGLEQLRFLENGMKIRAISVDYAGRPAMSGIDSPEDVVRAEALLKEYVS